MIIYVFIYIIQLIITIALPTIVISIIFYLTYKFGFKKRKSFNFWIAIFISAIPFLWIYSGYKTFTESCNQGIKITKNNEVAIPAKGIRSGFGRNALGLRDLLEDGTFQCIEYFARFLNETKDGSIGSITLYTNNFADRQFIRVKNFEKSDCTNFHIVVGEVEEISFFSKPYNYENSIEIKTIDTNETLAIVREQLWGGGLMSLYGKMFGDFYPGEYLACGYVSEEPHPWRYGPNMTDDYSKADRQLILSVLEPE